MSELNKPQREIAAAKVGATPMGDAFNAMFENLELLEHVVGRVEDRFETLRLRSPSEPINKSIDVDEAPKSAMRSSVDSTTNRIRSARIRLETLLEEVEL